MWPELLEKVILYLPIAQGQPCLRTVGLHTIGIYWSTGPWIFKTLSSSSESLIRPRSSTVSKKLSASSESLILLHSPKAPENPTTRKIRFCSIDFPTWEPMVRIILATTLLALTECQLETRSSIRSAIRWPLIHTDEKRKIFPHPCMSVGLFAIISKLFQACLQSTERVLYSVWFDIR